MKHMKRAAAYLLACVVLCAAMAGCGSQQEQEETQQQGAVSSEQGEQEQMPSEVPESVGTVFEQYEAGLEGEGISYERVQMAAEIVGATEGVKYKIGDGAVELYLFDEADEAYAQVLEKQSLTMEGFGAFPATVENGMAIIVSDLEEETYLDIFHSIVVSE